MAMILMILRVVNNIIHSRIMVVEACLSNSSSKVEEAEGHSRVVRGSSLSSRLYRRGGIRLDALGRPSCFDEETTWKALSTQSVLCLSVSSSNAHIGG
jgi:hypothetical protein